MTETIVGSSLGPFGDAIFGALSTDGTLLALATGGVYTSLPRDGRVDFPYVTVGQRRELTNSSFAGAMQLDGGHARVWVDVWSDYNGPSQVQDIQSRIRVLRQRQPLRVVGYTVLGGSVNCESELVFPDVDTDMPTRSLFHGVQQWGADIEAAI